jgi:Dyp-type peroxidase family
VDLDLDNIQGNIVPGFSKDYQTFVVARFRGADAGRTWLSSVQPELASANEVQGFKIAFTSVKARKPHAEHRDEGALHHVSATWVNLALSWAGLRLLVGASSSARFAPAFRGNRVPGAQVAEGDHALLIIAADHAADLEAELARQRQLMASTGVDEVACFSGATLTGDQRGHEHFGFKDGISQPRIAGTPWGSGPPVAAGEFVLGYPDQTGRASGDGLPAWTRNGSFLAFLQLQQHVETFSSVMKQQARQFGVQPEDVAAWIVGRKRDASGTQLSDPPARVSHIGRGYARWLAPSESLRHRIIRRGVPYGPQWVEGEPDDGQRGLLFVAYQADLERQFEHVWVNWLNAPGFPIQGAGRDALIGQTSWPVQPASTGTRPTVAMRTGQSGAMVHMSLPAFVTPRYGGYFFAPAIDAVSDIASVASTRS